MSLDKKSAGPGLRGWFYSLAEARGAGVIVYIVVDDSQSRAGRILRPAEARSRSFGAFRRLRPAGLMDGGCPLNRSAAREGEIPGAADLHSSIIARHCHWQDFSKTGLMGRRGDPAAGSANEGASFFI